MGILDGAARTFKTFKPFKSFKSFDQSPALVRGERTIR